eukprot:366106-Chlamydomonas_euryale.AAC.1
MFGVPAWPTPVDMTCCMLHEGRVMHGSNDRNIPVRVRVSGRGGVFQDMRKCAQDGAGWPRTALCVGGGSKLNPDSDVASTTGLAARPHLASSLVQHARGVHAQPRTCAVEALQSHVSTVNSASCESYILPLLSWPLSCWPGPSVARGVQQKQ